MALILDEYDAGRPDIMFVIQRLLEKEGKLALMEQNRVITPHPQFRLFATANTVGLGNVNGLYHGTQVLNHAQLDRWNLTATLNYLPAEQEAQIVLARVPEKTHLKEKSSWIIWCSSPILRDRVLKREIFPVLCRRAR